MKRGAPGGDRFDEIPLPAASPPLSDAMSEVSNDSWIDLGDASQDRSNPPSSSSFAVRSEEPGSGAGAALQAEPYIAGFRGEGGRYGYADGPSRTRGRFRARDNEGHHKCENDRRFETSCLHFGFIIRNAVTR